MGCRLPSTGPRVSWGGGAADPALLAEPAMPPGRVAGARRWLDRLLFWSLPAQLLRALASPTPFPGSPFLFPVAPSPHGGLDSRHTTHTPHAASPRVCGGFSEISHCLSDGTKPLMGTEPGAPEWAAEGSAVPWRETAQHACAPGPLSPPLGSATILCLTWSHPPSGDPPPQTLNLKSSPGL